MKTGDPIDFPSDLSIGLDRKHLSLFQFRNSFTEFQGAKFCTDRMLAFFQNLKEFLLVVFIVMIERFWRQNTAVFKIR